MRSEARLALEVAREAAAIVMRVYAEPFDVEYKSKDDPVTRADTEANTLIVERLARAAPGIPVVAEESDPANYAYFAAADAAWFVDPLDGTREFVARNGEFAVMIGLAERGRASLGAIVAPAWRRAFVGIVGEGAWEIAADGSQRRLSVTSRSDLATASIVVSRSRGPAKIDAFAAALGVGRAVPVGSSGIKGVLVATGEHDAYTQPGRAGMRWDACATEALVIAAGGACTDAYGDAFDYRTKDIENSRGLVASNGKIHAALIRALEERREQEGQKIRR